MVVPTSVDSLKSGLIISLMAGVKEVLSIDLEALM